MRLNRKHTKLPPRCVEFALLRSVTIAQKNLDYKVWHMTSAALPEAQLLEFSHLQIVGRGALSPDYLAKSVLVSPHADQEREERAVISPNHLDALVPY